MSAGREFHVCGATTENARRASSVRTRRTVSSGATDDRRGRAGAVGWISSLRYAGVEVDIILNVDVAILCHYALHLCLQPAMSLAYTAWQE